jgi:hypothetical protein
MDDDLFTELKPSGQPSAAPAAPARSGSRNAMMEDDLFDELRAPAQRQAAPSPAAAPTGASSPAVNKALQLTSTPPTDMDWGQVASEGFRNIPKSAVEQGKALVQPFLHPIETAESIGQIGKGLYSKAAGALGAKQDEEQKARDEAAANAVGDFYARRYGSMAGFKEALAQDPVGVLADASTVLTGGGSAAARLPGMVGKAGEVAGTVGRVVDPINLAVQAPKAAAKAVTSVTNYPLSLQSGVSYKSLQQAVDAGAGANPVFWEHVTGKVEPSQVVDRVNNAISQVAKQRSDDYMREMSAATGRNPQALNYNLVDQALSDAQNIAMPRGRVFDPNSGKVQIFNNVQKLINDWKADPKNAHTMADFDLLKREIREYAYANTKPGTPERKMLEGIAEAAKSTIPDKKYAEIMEQYQNATRELNDLNADLVNRKGSTTSQISKILRNQDKKSKGDLIKRLEEFDPDLPAAIAGVELNPMIPAGLRGQLAGMLASNLSLVGLSGAAGHPGPLAGVLLSSPRLAGLMNYGIGRTTGLPANLYEKSPALADIAAQTGRAAEIEQANRPGRASGGRISHEIEANRLVRMADVAKKQIGSGTEQILNAPDELVVKALKVANQKLEG